MSCVRAEVAKNTKNVTEKMSKERQRLYITMIVKKTAQT